MDNIITIKNIVKKYKIGEKEFKALDGVNLSLKRGELIVVLGPSGAGKSTLLNIIGGMDSPTSGDLIINDKNISKYNDKELSEFRANNIGFIFQFYNILPSLTVKENVEIVREIVKDSMNASEALKSVGLLKHENKFPSQISGGEQQRVSIARAIAKKPELLLCDEPTGALDSETGVQILKLIKDLTKKENPTTVIIVTHNSLIAEIADTVVHVKNGKIEEVIKNTNPREVSEVKW